MLPHVIIFIFLIAATGGFIQRVSGFGLGIFAMLFFPFLLSSSNDAAVLSGAISCVGSFYNAIKYRKYIQYKKIIFILVSAIIVSTLIICIVQSLHDSTLKKLLGIVLIFLSLYFLFLNNKIKIKENIKNSLITGFLSGALNGLFSTGGPPVVLYLINVTNDNTVYLATIQAYFAILGLYSFVVRFINGIVPLNIFTMLAIGILGLMSGNFIGERVFDKLDTNKLKLIIYIGMVISGVLMLL